MDVFKELLAKVLKSSKTEMQESNQPVIVKPFEVPSLLERLERMEQDRDLSVLPDCYALLLKGDRSTKLRVAEVLKNTLSSLSITALSRVDLLCRARSSVNWSYDWRNEDPSNLVDPVMSDIEKTIVLGLASLVRLVTEKIAEIKGLSFEDIAAITTNNAKRLFAIS